ncbi:MAG: fluoride efflux transporter CrcB [Micavibrio sp.]|nr:fluoride efflux transporter CrcB [Micavibrio sp.]
MIQTIAAIAAGGAIGAVLRYGAGLGAVKLLGHGFPYGTLFVNIVGSAIMGALIVIFAYTNNPPETLRVFMVTGLLGAFTTFSTFSLDFASLVQRADYLSAGLYLTASVVVSIAALFTAMAITRSFFA